MTSNFFRKRIELGAVDTLTSEYRVQLADFSKLASEGSIAEFISSFTPDPNYRYIHVIAMGAGEYYGCNQNADYFPERVLQERHETFEQHAKVFKEHNNKPDSPSFGIVPKSWYNETMKRVELILGIDKQKAPDLVARIDNGEILEVSMGAKVPYDICSICNHKATPAAGYCSHIKLEKRKIKPDGSKAFMINLQPTFFDISIVKKRADKVAFMLAKVASVGGGSGTSSADYEPAPYDPDEAFDFDMAPSIKKRAAEDFIKTIPSEGVLSVNFKKLLPSLEAIEPDMSPDTLTSMASSGSLLEILTTALVNMIPLKPSEFAYIALQQGLITEDQYQPLLSEIEVLKNTKVDTSGLDLSANNINEEIAKALRPYIPYRSSYLPYVTKRVDILKEASYNRGFIDPRDIAPAGTAPAYDYVPGDRGPLSNYRGLNYMVNSSNTPERLNPNPVPLREPLGPLGVLTILSGIYAASKAAPTVTKLLGLLNKTASISDTRFYQTYNFDKFAGLGMEDLTSGLTKVAYKPGSFMKYYVAPFVGTHLVSSHYRRKHNEGHELNTAQRVVAENPDVLSIAAPFALNFAKGAIKSGFKAKKVASEGLTRAETSALEKFASSWGDIASDALVQSIILPGRSISAANSLLMAGVDQAVLKGIGGRSIQNNKKRKVISSGKDF